MKKHLTLLAGLFIIGQTAFSQNLASCILGDSLYLNIENYRGSVNWQLSYDHENWIDIEGSSDQLTILPTVTSKWVRAKIKEESCPMFYDIPFLISAVDTAISGFQRNNLSIEQLPATFVSEDENGLLLFDLNANEFPLSAGDWLAGFEGQETMKQIDAIIIINGIAKVFTSVSTISVYDIPLNLGSIRIGKVMGRVLDETGNAINFVNVQIGTQSQLTDINGVFLFEAATLSEKVGYVIANKAGYFQGSRTFVPKAEGSVVEIRLLAKNLAGNFNSNSGGTVTLENVQLQFPPNAISLNGAAYSGNVKVFINYINPESQHFFQEMPGNLIANKNGNIRGLTSFGMMGIQMTNDENQNLQISSGQMVTANFPLSPELLSTAENTIDLWSFSDSQGVWIYEGEAIKDGNFYTAQLSHFSFWNCDQPWEAVFLNGNITDVNGNSFPGVTVNITNPLIGSANDITNSFGNFGGLVPANTELNVSLSYPCGTGSPIILLNNLIIGPYEGDTVKFIQNVQMSELSTVQGNVQDCEGVPLEIGYVISGTHISYINDGNFSFNTCIYTDSIQLASSNPMIFGEWQPISLDAGVNELGTLVLCGGDTIITDLLSDIDGNIYNTVLIGNQWWMAENLKTTRYSDGSVLPNPENNDDWMIVNAGAWCYWDNDSNFDAIYGKLYNWQAVVDPRNVCPVGWHAPNDTEWNILINNLGGISVAGGKMKSLSSWNSTNEGASNLSGFSALPGSSRDFDGYWNFNPVGTLGYYMSTSVSGSSCHVYYLKNNEFKVFTTYLMKPTGVSVRCLKN